MSFLKAALLGGVALISSRHLYGYQLSDTTGDLPVDNSAHQIENAKNVESTANEAISNTPMSQSLSVVVIEINNTADHTNYSSKILEGDFASAANAISDYFFEKFGVSTKIISAPEETTADGLSHYFREEFPKVADRKVVALFILSHGEVENRSDDPGFKNDLTIVTSDSTKPGLPRNSLSFTRDLYPVFSSLHPGSVTLVFIDACHSGSADNSLVRIESTLRDRAGQKMLIMASSLPTELASGAAFTSSLIDLWADAVPGECVTPQISRLKLQERIAHKLNLAGSDAPSPPEVIVDYSGLLCLDALAGHNGVLVLKNPSGSTIQVMITDPSRMGIDPTDDASPYQRDVGPYATLFVRLNRDRKYLLRVLDRDQPVEELIDLGELHGIRVKNLVPNPQLDVAKEARAEAALYRDAFEFVNSLGIQQSGRMQALQRKAEYVENLANSIQE